jgi:CheY-like chemotaxis protein
MHSRFFYPTNASSLGEPRRVRNSGPGFEPPTSLFGPESNRIANEAGKRTVLVVEDDDNSLFVLKEILGTMGYRVLQAWDGKQAIEVAESEPLDLMLLDVQLPGLNGLGVIRRLRENASLESLPIVIMTAYDPEKCRGNAIAAGCDDFLLKPIDFDRLEVILEYFVPLAH